jgi:uncharacterized protein (TIGR00375 family)
MAKCIADLEIHSRFSRAVSKDMNIATLESWGIKKGVELIGTGDFTHPTWFGELQAELEEAGEGIYKRRGSTSTIRFLLSAEISCIFSRNGVRRIHTLVYAPNLGTAERLNARLGKVGKLKSDGRPIIGMDIIELVKICQDVDPAITVVPAHVWTPWFGMYGSSSGFDSINECFGEVANLIPAVETGLSSDPPMNWRLSELDTRSIVSFSDAHSAKNIGREATIFQLAEISFSNFVRALHVPFPTERDQNRILETIEFFPEEGMYHWDGHRSHNIRLSPSETKKRQGLCPRCGTKVTVGVMHRVENLSDRPEGYDNPKRPRFKKIIPLAEVIGEALDVGKLTKTVQKEYDRLIATFGSEFKILLDVPVSDLKATAQPGVVEGIQRVREGKLHIEPGYDGVYGTVHIFTDKERKQIGQASLI